MWLFDDVSLNANVRLLDDVFVLSSKITKPHQYLVYFRHYICIIPEGFGPHSGPKASPLDIFKLHLPSTFITSIDGQLSFMHFGVEKVNLNFVYTCVYTCIHVYLDLLNWV